MGTVPAEAAEFAAMLAAAAQQHDVPCQRGRVAWRSFGAGPALVLLHGGHGTWLHWARNIAALSAGHTLWIPDMPGFGDSDALPEPSLTALVEALHTTLDALIGVSAPAVIVGFSFGGLVAAHLAVRRAPKGRLALLGPAGHGGLRRPIGDLRPWRPAVQQGDTAALQVVMRHNLHMHMLHAPEAIDELALHIHSEACQRTRFVSKALSRAGCLRQALAGHHGPLLAAWGEHDVTADPKQAAPRLSAGRAQCQTHIVPDAGHWLQYERADAVNRLLLGWLDRTEPRIRHE